MNDTTVEQYSRTVVSFKSGRHYGSGPVCGNRVSRVMSGLGRANVCFRQLSGSDDSSTAA